MVSQCTLGQPVAFQWHSSVHWTSQYTLAQGKRWNWRHEMETINCRITGHFQEKSTGPPDCPQPLRASYCVVVAFKLTVDTLIWNMAFSLDNLIINKPKKTDVLWMGMLNKSKIDMTHSDTAWWSVIRGATDGTILGKLFRIMLAEKSCHPRLWIYVISQAMPIGDDLCITSLCSISLKKKLISLPLLLFLH